LNDSGGGTVGVASKIDSKRAFHASTDFVHKSIKVQLLKNE